MILISPSMVPLEGNLGDDIGRFVLAKALARGFLEQVTNSNWTSAWLTDGIATFISR